MQGIARMKSLRISFLSGDVHCAAVGVLKTLVRSNGGKNNRTIDVPPETDYRYMINVVTSMFCLLPLKLRASILFQVQSSTHRKWCCHLLYVMKRVESIEGLRMEWSLWYLLWRLRLTGRCIMRKPMKQWCVSNPRNDLQQFHAIITVASYFYEGTKWQLSPPKQVYNGTTELVCGLVRSWDTGVGVRHPCRDGERGRRQLWVSV